MAIVGKWVGDGQITGKLYLGDEVINQKGSPILAASDTDHQHCLSFFQAGTAADATICLGEMIGAGTILRASIWCVTACIGAATIDVDFLKNGVTILSAALQLDSADAARAVVGISPPNVTAFVDGDVFEATVDETAGGGTVGVNLWGGIWVNQDYAGS